jgi:hypothetical protein
MRGTAPLIEIVRVDSRVWDFMIGAWVGQLVRRVSRDGKSNQNGRGELVHNR